MKADYDRAIADFIKVIEIDPEFAKTYAVRATAGFKNEQSEDCRRDVKAAQELGYKFEPAFLDSVRNAAGNKQ
ncbi:hypothetical protein ACFL3Q_11930 [Planctomycetota bacterium]